MLNVFDIRGIVLRRLQSVVCERSQYVAIGLERSTTTALLSDVPQGSIFGPLLFWMCVSPSDDVVPCASDAVPSISELSDTLHSARAIHV